MRHALWLARTGRGALLCSISLILTGPPARALTPSGEEDMAAPLTRERLVALAVASSPSVRAADERAHASDAAARAQGRLPAPEAMVQAFQVPISRPYALGDAQMLMLGVSQSFPAPGSLEAHEEAKLHGARASRAMAADRARLVAREAEHAFADYVEAAERHHVHRAHEDVARHVLSVATGRTASGGGVAEVVQAEVELARVQADLLADGARVGAARGHVNALLGRSPTAELGPPVEDVGRVPAWSVETTLAKAREARPELLAAAAEQQAQRAELRGDEREATWPAFTVGASYFAPTTTTPVNGYGLSASMTLPWLWGPASARRDAQRRYWVAAEEEVRGVERQVEVDVVTADLGVRSAALRLQVLRERVVPATRRALDVALGGYESGRADMLTLLQAQRAAVDAEEDVVASRAALEHAFADLDAAAGVAIPREPISPLGAKETSHE